MEGRGHGCRNAAEDVVEQLEPAQYVKKWMPVLSLENYPGTKVVNGQLCWFVFFV